MKKILLIAGAMVAMSFASTSAFATTCSTFVTASSETPCTTSDGNFSISFNGISTGTQFISALSDSGGQLIVSFSPSTPQTSATIGYTATCLVASACGSFTGYNDSGTPNSSSTFTFSVGGSSPGSQVCTGNGSGCVGSVSTGSSIYNSATFSTTSGSESTITLQSNFSPVSATPEPTSMILLGSGFLAIGLAARKRRKA